MTKRVLVYGGAFDPPHYGHLLTIVEALTFAKPFDKLWLMPSYIDYFGIKRQSERNHRTEMLKLFIRNAPFILRATNVEICTFELDNRCIDGTYATITALKKAYPDFDFSVLIGSDQAELIKRWSNSKKLIEEVKFVIVPRGEVNYTKLIWALGNKDFHTILPPAQNEMPNISSTLIREHLRNNVTDTRLLLPESISYYAIKNNLYIGR